MSKAVQLNGENQYAWLATAPAISGSYTFECWLYLFDTHYSWLLSTEGYQTMFGFYGGNQLNDYIGAGISWLYNNLDTLSISHPVGTWFHFAFVVSPGGFVVYINASPVFSGSFGAGTPWLGGKAGTDPRLYLGIYQNGTSYGLYGAIEEVRIWNAALSQATLNAWKGNRVTSSHPNFANLQIYWQCNEGSGTSLTDSSGNGHTGALVNNPTWIDGYTLDFPGLPGGSTTDWKGSQPSQEGARGPLPRSMAARASGEGFGGGSRTSPSGGGQFGSPRQDAKISGAMEKGTSDRRRSISGMPFVAIATGLLHPLPLPPNIDFQNQTIAADFQQEDINEDFQ